MLARAVATAMLAALAIGAAGPAWAAPVLSGHYTAIDTSEGGGQPYTSNWGVTPCGDGCANISENGGSPYTAHLVNGQQRVWNQTDTQASSAGSSFKHI